MKNTIDIDYFGTDLEVVYNTSKYRPATHDQPEEGGEIEIASIKDGDIDIMDELTAQEIEEITDLIIKQTI